MRPAKTHFSLCIRSLIRVFAVRQKTLWCTCNLVRNVVSRIICFFLSLAGVQLCKIELSCEKDVSNIQHLFDLIKQKVYILICICRSVWTVICSLC